MGGKSDALVTPLVWGYEQATKGRAQNRQQIQPKLIPVTVTKVDGETITVKADMQGNYTIPEIEIPQSYSAWIRQPTQVGDKGLALASDFYLGGQSDLGGGTSNFYPRGNLTSLTFIPVSQTNFPVIPHRNLNATLVTGPQGAVVQDSASNTVLTVDGQKMTYVDNKGNKVLVDTGSNTIKIVLGHGSQLYLGGDGVTGTYGQVATTAGPCASVFARVDAP